MYIVPNIPHLRNLTLTVAYRELPETEAQMVKWDSMVKWKSDPGADRFHGFAPRNKYYVNGQLVKEERPGLSKASKTPFPDRRVPRRGLLAVSPEDPDYARLCQEQGLESLLTGDHSPGVPNGVHSSSSPTNGAAPLPAATRENGNVPSRHREGHGRANGTPSQYPLSDLMSAATAAIINGLSVHGGGHE